ncbi:hypothetical protein FPL06_20760 [Xanthomonas citri pv. glycines]|nr:hypothetical protein [Xanthomonas citri]TSK03108.1 hypothetical protein FPL06_20760 [Xanthomonas citri pv. glycines]
MGHVHRQRGTTRRLHRLLRCWLLAVGCWLLAVGCWLLAVGCWPLSTLRAHRQYASRPPRVAPRAAC